MNAEEVRKITDDYLRSCSGTFRDNEIVAALVGYAALLDREAETQRRIEKVRLALQGEHSSALEGGDMERAGHFEFYLSILDGENDAAPVASEDRQPETCATCGGQPKKLREMGLTPLFCPDCETEEWERARGVKHPERDRGGPT